MEISVLFILVFASLSAKAVEKDSTIYYNLPGSVSACRFFAEINAASIPGKNEAEAGIKTGMVKLSMEAKSPK
jgi:hypothetical protein